ncbi:unnamed protein product [Brachionus calyciflorus]|uniref:MULE transposase domain-containing protein n=1 Tax=Brachionus calyciflorus TaxID=104777 RepID=A0A814PPU5_9BILA|nr:unnamed protein product [Brachionus calyciflorus]
MIVYPSSFSSDFERAFLNAVSSVFPESNLSCCFFHFKQSMWRNIQEFGLSIEYRTSHEMYQNLLMPQCLAYLPPDDVVSAFNELKEKIPIDKDERLKKFYVYFEETYVSKYTESRGRYNKKILLPTDPMFPINLWNIHHRYIENKSRTNNFCESWHNAFSGILNAHPVV